MPLGMVFLLAFLILFLFAALTSAFSMLEIIVAASTRGEEKKRKKAAWMIGLCIFLVGVPSALSYGIWSDVSIFGLIIFDAVDFLVSNILLPVGALLIAVFIPLRMSREVLMAEFTTGNTIGRSCLLLGCFLLSTLYQSQLYLYFCMRLVHLIGS